MKENLLMLKYLLEHLKLKSINTIHDISKNVYIDKLDDIVGEYNNTYQNN